MSHAEDLERLANLLDSGAIAPGEFERLKADVLGSRVDQTGDNPQVTRANPGASSGADEDKSSTRWWVIGGGIFMAVGSLLPWAQSGIFSVAGTSGDGVITLILGGVAAFVGIARRESFAAAWLVIICGAFGAWIAWGTVGRLDVGVAGTGVYLTGLSAVVVALSGLDLLRDRRQSRRRQGRGSRTVP